MPFPEANVPALVPGLLLPALHYLFGLSAALAAGGAVLMLLPALEAGRSLDPRWGRLAGRSARWTLALLLGALLAGGGAWLGEMMLHPRAAERLAAAFGPALAAGALLALTGTLCLALYAFGWKNGRGGGRVHLAVGAAAAAGIWAGALVAASLGSFSLSPGNWPESRLLRHALLHPSAPPAILLWAAGAILFSAAAGLAAAAGERDAPWRRALARTLGSWGAPAAWAGAAGTAWWAYAVWPKESPGFTALAGGAAAVQLGLGVFLYRFAARDPRKLSQAKALLALLAAALAPGLVQLAGAEARGLFLIRGDMYRNGILAAEIPELRREGFWRPAAWRAGHERPAARELGGLVFRAECGPCHPAWKEGAGELPPFREQGAPLRFLGEMEKRHPAFPAFAGSDEEMKAVASHIEGMLKEAGVALAVPAPTAPSRPAPPAVPKKKEEEKKPPAPAPAAAAPRQGPLTGQPAPPGQPAPQGQPAPLGQPAPKGEPASKGQPEPPARAPVPAPAPPAPAGPPAPQPPQAPQIAPAPQPSSPPVGPAIPEGQPSPGSPPVPPGQPGPSTTPPRPPEIPPPRLAPPGPVPPAAPVQPVPPVAPEPVPSQRREEPRPAQPPTLPPPTPPSPPASPGGGTGTPGVPGP